MRVMTLLQYWLRQMIVRCMSSSQTAASFLLLREGEGCRTVTEEVVKGPRAIDFRGKQPAAMHEGHDLWLSAFKQRSEQ